MKYFALIILIFSIGCSKKTNGVEQQDEGTVGTSVIDTQTGRTNDSIDVDFKKFIGTFSSDSVYQTAHVKFPLKVIKIADPVLSGNAETNDSIYSINVSQYGLLDLVTPSSENYGDVMSVNTYPAQEEMVVEVSGKEGRVHFEYLFYRQRKEWFLKEVVDYSF